MAKEATTERNKALKLARHIKIAPWDECARSAFDRLPAPARSGLVLPPLAKSPATVRAERGITLTRVKSNMSAIAA